MQLIYQNEFLENAPQDLQAAYISGLVELRDIELSGIRLPMLSFDGTRLVNCKFAGTELMFDRFLGCDIIGCDFDSLNLNKATFLGVHFVECRFKDIHSYRVEIYNEIGFENCVFDNFKIEHSFLLGEFRNCQFANTQFAEAIIPDGRRSLEVKGRKDGRMYVDY